MRPWRYCKRGVSDIGLRRHREPSKASMAIRVEDQPGSSLCNVKGVSGRVLSVDPLQRCPPPSHITWGTHRTKGSDRQSYNLHGGHYTTTKFKQRAASDHGTDLDILLLLLTLFLQARAIYSIYLCSGDHSGWHNQFRPFTLAKWFACLRSRRKMGEFDVRDMGHVVRYQC